MSLVYYVAPGQETDGEPSSGWYYADGEGEPHGPYLSRDNALGFAAERREPSSQATNPES